MRPLLSVSVGVGVCVWGGADGDKEEEEADWQSVKQPGLVPAAATGLGLHWTPLEWQRCTQSQAVCRSH